MPFPFFSFPISFLFARAGRTLDFGNNTHFLGNNKHPFTFSHKPGTLGTIHTFQGTINTSGPTKHHSGPEKHQPGTKNTAAYGNEKHQGNKKLPGKEKHPSGKPTPPGKGKHHSGNEKAAAPRDVNLGLYLFYMPSLCSWGVRLRQSIPPKHTTVKHPGPGTPGNTPKIHSRCPRLRTDQSQHFPDPFKRFHVASDSSIPVLASSA